MQVTIDAQALSEALRRDVTQRSTMPIIEHALVLADSDNGTLRITTTDMEKRLRYVVPANVKEGGAATLEPRRLRAAVRGLEGELQIAHKKGMTTVSQARRRFQFPSLKVEDWPELDVGAAEDVEMDSQALGRALDKVSYCASKDMAQMYANGVRVGGDFVCAFNGMRMAYCPLDGGLPETIIPHASLSLLRHMLDEEGARLRLYKAHDKPNALEIYTDRASLTTQLISTQYPPVIQFIKQDMESGPRYMDAEVRHLRHALERVLPFTLSKIDSTKVARIFITPGDGYCALSSTDDNATDDLPAETSGFVQIAVNSEWLGQALGAIGHGKVRLQLVDPPGGERGSSMANLYMIPAEGDDIHMIAPQRI